jgi:hypothetical protein
LIDYESSSAASTSQVASLMILRVLTSSIEAQNADVFEIKALPRMGTPSQFAIPSRCSGSRYVWDLYGTVVHELSGADGADVMCSIAVKASSTCLRALKMPSGPLLVFSVTASDTRSRFWSS